jgi:hypothetical protein
MNLLGCRFSARLAATTRSCDTEVDGIAGSL